MLGNALFGSLACFACWPQLNLHAYTITRGVGHPQSHQSFFCPTVIIYLAARQRLCLHHTCDPAKATSKAHSRGNTFSVCLVTSIDKRGFAVGPANFEGLFLNHHAISLSQGVGHPPSHRLKSFSLTFGGGGLPPSRICQEKRGVFFGMFSTFL